MASEQVRTRCPIPPANKILLTLNFEQQMSSLSLLNTQQRGVLVYHMGPKIFFLPKPYVVRSMPEKQFWAPVMRWLPFDVFGTGYVVEVLM